MTDQLPSPSQPRKTFVLCFDGTGNKFSGDETDSNILKIYRMLDRADGKTFTFYQPGIGTYVASSHMSHTSSMYSKIKSWYLKSKDAAVGTSFAEHVMGGYRFLMRYYSSEDDLYFFGFSRGAYTARFLAEMLDHVGLLSAGNEELQSFAWKTYAKWASRRSSTTEKEKEQEEKLYNYMKGFRETFSRPVRRIRFLGLFDTVNSVPAFEGAWMQRSKFPYTAKSRAKVIRHAVSIDERRAKFRQDLISGSKKPRSAPKVHHDDIDTKVIGNTQDWGLDKSGPRRHGSLDGLNSITASAAPSINITEADETILKSLDPGRSVDVFADAHEHPTTLQVEPQPIKSNQLGQIVDFSTEALQQYGNDDQPISQLPEHRRLPRRWSDVRKSQDIQEVWFPGCHGDIGGGWARTKGESKMISHVPLTWMVLEAEKAGLKFDPVKMKALGCCPDEVDIYGNRYEVAEALNDYHGQFHSASVEGKIHDCLIFGNGLGNAGVASWKMMEYLPFRRMDLQPDGSWKAIRWPLPEGETRDIPHDAQIHISAFNRMDYDPKYRPGNLIIGGGGRGVRFAPENYKLDQWKVHQNEGHKILQTFVRADEPHKEK